MGKFLKTVLYILFLVTYLVATDDPVFEHISIDQGLSSSTVFSILQDDGGFMWFGTVNGLDRYDGYQFRVYEFDPQDSTSISNNSAGNIYKDRQGYIWIGTWGGGLNRFDPQTNRAVRYEHDAVDSTSISGNRVQCIYQDRAGRIWAGTYANGLNLLKPDGTFEHFMHDPDRQNSLSHNRIWSLVEDDENCLWIGTTNGLNRMDLTSGEIKRFSTTGPAGKALTHNTVRALCYTTNGQLWIGTENGLLQYIFKTGRFKSYFTQPAGTESYNRARVNHILEARDGNLWIATGFGVIQMSPKTGNWKRYRHDPTKSTSLGDTEIRCVFEDRSGTLWFGTRGRGVDKYNPAHKKFNNLTFNVSPEQASKQNTIFSICKSADKLYMNNFGSMLIYNLTDGSLTRKSQFGIDRSRLGEERKRTLYHSPVDSNILWLSIGQNVLQYNIKTGQEKSYLLPGLNEAGQPFKRIIAIYQESRRYLWLGYFQGGIRKLDLATGKVIKHYYHDKEDSTSLGHNEIWFIQSAGPGKLWIGTGKGLNLLDTASDKFLRLHFSKSVKYSLCMFTAFQKPGGYLWLGTDYGLLRYDAETGSSQNYTKKNGLPDEQIYSITADNDGDLWLGTGKGLCKFDPETGYATSFSVEDGLINQEYLPGSIYYSKDGYIYIGGMKGLDYFRPKEIRINKRPPRIALTDLKILNRSVEIGADKPLQKDIAYTHKITLKPSDYFFTLQFAALDYTNPVNNAYAYKLEGFDKDWIYTDSKNRTASYTTLPGGDYKFRVRGANADGIWNEDGAELAITIIPPFWETLWFRLITLIALGAFVIVIIRIRTQGIKHRSQELEHINAQLKHQIAEREKAETEKEKLQEQLLQSQKMEALGTLAGGVAHDFNNLLTVINGHTEIALLKKDLNTDEKRHFEAIQQSSNRAEELTRQLLAFGRKQMVNAQVININNIVEKGQQMLRRLIPADIQIESHLSSELPNIKADPNQIDQILINLIINARDAIQLLPKSSGQKLITIRTDLVLPGTEISREHAPDEKEKYLLLSISDTGIGINPKDEAHIFEPFYTTKKVNKGTGLGLATVYGIVSQNKGKIFVQSKPGEGTSFYILWPATNEKIKNKPVHEYSIKDLSGTERLLLVEDEAAVRDFAAQILIKFGYKIEYAENGRQALDIVRQSTKDFDLIITDLIMPEMNGSELISELDGQIDPSRVLYVSGYTFDQLMDKGKLREGIQFLQKPYTMHNLLSKVRLILDGKEVQLAGREST